jgi:hypothetical protein
MSVDERWLPIPGFPMYEASSLGRVRTHRPFGGPPGRPRKEPLILRASLDHYGYPRIGLRRDGDAVSRTHPVHVVVLMAFVGPRPKGCECRHLNGNKRDNRVSNLAWGTPAENGRDMVLHGSHAGERNSNSRLTADDVRQIRASDKSTRELSRQYRISEKHVSCIIQRKAWRHVA